MKAYNQLELPLDMPVKAPHKPSQAVIRVNAIGRLPQDSGRLRNVLDDICIKHHDGLPDMMDYDDLSDYGYDGDIW